MRSPLSPTAGVTYTHDGDGWRVKKLALSGAEGSNGTIHWRSLSGEILAETDLSGTNLREYIYFAGRRVARRDANGTVYYFLQDHLGSTRVITNASGSVVRDSDYYPHGTEKWVSGTVDDPHKFAGMYLDSESGLYYTWFRMYSPSLGRWLSPDPMAGSILNPQSLNRYAYVLNNPCNLTDPLGLCGQLPTSRGTYWITDQDVRPGGAGWYDSPSARGAHNAIDLRADRGVPIYPLFEGTVTAVGEMGDLGWGVEVESGDWRFRVGHFDAPSEVSLGQQVHLNTVLGLAGTSGNAGGLTGDQIHTHLLVERRVSGQQWERVDPYMLLNSLCPEGLNAPWSLEPVDTRTGTRRDGAQGGGPSGVPRGGRGVGTIVITDYGPLLQMESLYWPWLSIQSTTVIPLPGPRRR